MDSTPKNSPIYVIFKKKCASAVPRTILVPNIIALSPTVDLSPAAFAGLGATPERRSSMGGGFTRPPLTPIQTSPLLSPLFNNAVAQQLASPLTPQNSEQNPLNAFAAPHLPATLLNNLSNM